MQIWTEILRELANFSDSEVTHTREIVKALTYIWISHDCRVKANCLAGQISPAAIWTELWPRQRALGLLYKGGTQACQEWATDNEKKMGTRWVRRCSLEWVGSHLYERKKKKRWGNKNGKIHLRKQTVYQRKWQRDAPITRTFVLFPPSY